MLQRGFIVGATRLTKRVWQLYVAHIILFVIYIAAISYLALRFGDSSLISEFNVAGPAATPPRRCDRACNVELVDEAGIANRSARY